MTEAKNLRDNDNINELKESVLQHEERTESASSSRGRKLREAERVELARRQDELLDAALLETFPASDPISVFRLA